MNILLDAYFDRNYGDDIFVETITDLFSGCKMYSFLEYYPQEICDWAEQIPNLYLLPESNVFLRKNMFDAYICVGGDIFPDKGDYTKRKAYVESVKQGNGTVAFLGFSLFHDYCEETRRDIIELMKDANIIAPRDELSVAVLQQMLPNKEIQSMADLAFSSDWSIRNGGEQKRSNILGVSVRRPNYADDNSMAEYCRELRNIITAYLQENETHRVRMFSLSDGSSADSEVVESILKEMPNKERIEHLVYNGNSAEMKAAIGDCELMICTRLHAMISCIAMNVPFIPIVYEVKMEHILKEISYTGAVFTFGRLQGMQKAFRDFAESLDATLRVLLWNEESTAAYLSRTAQVLEKLYCLLGMRKDAPKVMKKDTSGATLEEKEYAKKQAEEVVKKNVELAEMAEKINTQQSALEENQSTIAQYLKTIEECNGTIAQYLKTIEECNQRNGEYFTLIEELNQNISKLSQNISKLSQEREQLITDRDSKENMLQKIRPYFTSRVGSKLTKVTGSMMRSEEVRENWDVIQQYFSGEKTME